MARPKDTLFRLFFPKGSGGAWTAQVLFDLSPEVHRAIGLDDGRARMASASWGVRASAPRGTSSLATIETGRYLAAGQVDAQDAAVQCQVDRHRHR